MKKFLPLLFIVIIFQGCLKDKHSEKRTYIANAPIYMTYEQLAKTIKSEAPKELCTPRKIYANGQYLFINEMGKGIHVIDNSNPSNPQNISFINIPGNVDMLVNGNYLYADSYSDLVTIDVSNVNNVKEICRESKVFKYILPEHNPNYPIGLIDPSKGVVIGFEIREVTDNCENGLCGELYNTNSDERLVLSDVTFGESGSGLQNGKMEGVSVAGSMSRFLLKGNTFYSISSASDIAIFDISNPSCPDLKNQIKMQDGIETLFTYNENLFIGAEAGMYIYNISDTENPDFVSVFEHVQSCDPVVVYEDKAYVTTRGTNSCGSWVNQLDVLDISNIQNPLSITSYSMDEPFGLAIDGQNDILFVCDGDNGVKIFENVSQQADNGSLYVSKILNNNGYDVIPNNGQMLLIGNDGLYQYNYSNISNITFIGSIATGQCE